MKRTRQSGIELLRIIAMILVMTQHINGLAIGLPGPSECAAEPVNSFIRLFIQSLAIVGVDVFVLISGWFGIRFKVKRLLEFLFQCLFFSVFVTLAVWLIHGRPDMDIKTLMGMVFLGKKYWFVKCYLLLYVISPILNKFIDTADKKETGLVTLLFMGIMLVFGWSDSMPEFNFGYSSISFVGLYLLARYVNKYCDIILNRPIWQYAICYVIPAALLALSCLVLYRFNAPEVITRCIFSYDNPLIIIGAMSLVLLFSRLDFYSAFINKVAKSSFSVYLFHCGPIVLTMFLTIAGTIYRSYSGIEMLWLMLSFILAVFVIACLIDQIRIALSKAILETDIDA